jgi:hypothetical protein
MKNIKRGDLVQGLKPWNSFASLGIVITEPEFLEEYSWSKCRVFWYAPEHSGELIAKRIFVLEELTESIEKIRSFNVQQNRL